VRFDEKLNDVFRILGCTNAELSRAGGIDPSLVSRFRTGSRRPRAASSQYVRLCSGLALIAREKGAYDRLSSECGLLGDDPEAEIQSFLLSLPAEAESRKQAKKPYNSNALFHEKLNASMNLLGISNVRLARALNVDTSLISRFRNGLRTPQKNGLFLNGLCAYFYRIMRLNGLQQELSELTGIPLSCVEEGGEPFAQGMRCWLFDETETQSAGEMDRFLERLDALSNTEQIRVPLTGNPVEIVFAEGDRKEYEGIQGIRRASLRFLCVAALSETDTLKLYSDQNLEWLSSDPVFLQKWAALMVAVLNSQKTVKIIHRIDRSLAEMLIGIEKWLPLYLSGLVEGYYCAAPAGPAFSHTLFVAPGTAAVSSSFVSGTDDEAVYTYADGEDRVAYFEKQADALFAISRPLIQVFQKNRSHEYHFLSGEASRTPGDVKRLLLSPSLATVPGQLLERMLLRAGTDEKKAEEILAARDIKSKQFERELMGGRVTEYIVFAGDEALLSGKVALNLSDAFSSENIFYTFEEYGEHIKALLRFLNSGNYDIVPLPASPFSNIQLSVKEDSSAFVQKADAPATVFRFSHPLMCRALGEYIESAGRRSNLSMSGKQALIQYLNRFTGC